MRALYSIIYELARTIHGLDLHGLDLLSGQGSKVMIPLDNDIGSLTKECGLHILERKV